MITKLLTNLLFEPKGVHDPALTYSIRDTVMSPDGSKVYFALRDVPSGIALTDENYWMLQIDLSGSKNAMDEAVAAFADYAKIVGTRVKGETAKATGNPVSFLPDAGSLLQPVTVLEPQQDGSGDPYPAGGGRNLLNNTATTQTVNGVTFTVNADGTVTVDGTATANAVFRIPCNLSVGETYTLSGCPAGGSTSTYFMHIGNFGNDTGSGVTATATENTSSNVALFVFSGYAASNLVFKPMIRLASDPDSTYAPYSNIRPFIGYDKLDLNHAGKNLLKKVSGDISTVYIDGNGVTFKEIGDAYFFAEADGLADGETVTLSFDVSNFSGTFELAPYNDLSYAKALTPNARNAFTFKYRAGAHDDGKILIDDRERDVSDVKLSNIQLERCSVATDYAAPVMTDHTVQIGQTVYGIRYEWLTGKAVIEWVMEAFDGTEDIGAQDDYGSFYTPKEPLGAGNSLCSHAWARGNEWFLGGGIAFITGLNRVIFYNSLFGTRNRDEFVAYLAAQNAAGTPVQIAYKLATPIEIQLTPHIISAVEPEQNNTLYGDGTIEVEYVKPLHVSIEERVAAALAAAAE